MISADQYERQMLALINAERALVGAAALELEVNLNLAAEDHSDWVLRTDIFDHTGAWGSQPSDRMADAGFDFVPGWGAAENIAVRSVSGNIEADVIALHNQLMNSSGHRANILNASLTHIGLGIEFGGYSYGTTTQYQSIMVTQVFAYTQGSVDLDSTELQSTPPNGGDEFIRGTLNDDTILGGVGEDRIVAFKGDDLLDGGTEVDKLFGKGGSDVLLGRRGDDKLFGGDGHDTLDGGTGSDLLYGDNGRDTFVYRPTYEDDRIKDYDETRDMIDLSAFGFATVNDALEYAKEQGAHVKFDFGLGDLLIINNVTKSELSDDLIV